MSAILIFFHFLSLALVSSGQSYIATFTNPPDGNPDALASDNEVFTIGDSLQVTWTTNASVLNLAIWQYSADSLNAPIGTLQYLPNSGKVLFSYLTRRSLIVL